MWRGPIQYPWKVVAMASHRDIRLRFMPRIGIRIRQRLSVTQPHPSFGQPVSNIKEWGDKLKFYNIRWMRDGQLFKCRLNHCLNHAGLADSDTWLNWRPIVWLACKPFGLPAWQLYWLASSELSMGWVHPWVGLGWIGLGRVFYIFGGLGWVVGPKVDNIYIHK